MERRVLISGIVSQNLAALRARSRHILAAGLIALAACETGTEPLSPGHLVGEYELALVDGFSLPIDVWESGTLTLRADSTYTMVINDEIWDAGTWRTEGTMLRVTATRGQGAPWFGFIQPHAILFPKDDVHNYNDYLFAE